MVVSTVEGLAKWNSNLLARVINQFKRISTITIRKNRSFFGWQERYFDKIIRNEKQYWAIKQYIKNNPINWENDTYFELKKTVKKRGRDDRYGRLKRKEENKLNLYRRLGKRREMQNNKIETPKLVVSTIKVGCPRAEVRAGASPQVKAGASYDGRRRPRGRKHFERFFDEEFGHRG